MTPTRVPLSLPRFEEGLSRASSRTQNSPSACSGLLTAAAPTLTDVPLAGGTANRGRVVRVGDTVVRPTAPCWPATHALLAHLAAAGFDGAPRVLGAGPATETLTYIAGRAALPPLHHDALTTPAIVI